MGMTLEEFEAMTRDPKFKAKVKLDTGSPTEGHGCPSVKSTKKQKRSSTLPELPKDRPKGLTHILGMLIALGVEHETEYKFDKKRLFRFDIAVPGMMLAVEYEGIFSDKSGHTSAGGYIKDCDKYNMATVQGWRILRYTGNNYKNFARDFNKLIDYGKATANT